MAGKTAGEYAYLLALVVAVLAGIATAAGALQATFAAWIALLLVILGVIVGLMNITDKEATGFLIAALALVVVGASGVADLAGTTGVFSPLNVIPGLGTLLNSIVAYLAIFAAPAAIVVAVKAVNNMARTK